MVVKVSEYLAKIQVRVSKVARILRSDRENGMARVFI